MSNTLKLLKEIYVSRKYLLLCKILLKNSMFRPHLPFDPNALFLRLLFCFPLLAVFVSVPLSHVPCKNTYSVIYMFKIIFPHTIYYSRFVYIYILYITPWQLDPWLTEKVSSILRKLKKRTFVYCTSLFNSLKCQGRKIEEELFLFFFFKYLSLF